MTDGRAEIDERYELDHRYTRESGRVYLTGIQALVRLPLMQRRRDLAAGINTAGFISGYRGRRSAPTTWRCGGRSRSSTSITSTSSPV